MYENVPSDLCCILMRLVGSVTMYMSSVYKSEMVPTVVEMVTSLLKLIKSPL
jgi:hypothetical protein